MTIQKGSGPPDPQVAVPLVKRSSREVWKRRVHRTQWPATNIRGKGPKKQGEREGGGPVNSREGQITGGKAKKKKPQRGGIVGGNSATRKVKTRVGRERGQRPGREKGCVVARSGSGHRRGGEDKKCEHCGQIK